MALALSNYSAAWLKCTFNVQESLQKAISDKSLQSKSNDHPAFCCAMFLLWQKPYREELEHFLE